MWFLYCIMKYVYIWGICIRQWISIFQIYDVTKSCIRERTIQHVRLTKILTWPYEKFTKMVWDCSLNLFFYFIIFWHLVSKKNIHDYIKRLLKCSSLFHLYICVRLDYFHWHQVKQYSKLECLTSIESNFLCLKQTNYLTI